MCALLRAELVANGPGRSATVILRWVPGDSCRKSVNGVDGPELPSPACADVDVAPQPDRAPAAASKAAQRLNVSLHADEPLCIAGVSSGSVAIASFDEGAVSRADRTLQDAATEPLA
jgi:hypothetical protein